MTLLIRRILLWCFILGFVVFGYFAITYIQVWRVAKLDSAQKSDAIVVMGAAQYNGKPSLVLRRRLDHAFQLYQHAFATRIVVTGGKAEGDVFSEATASANYLLKLGVPENALLREVSARNTWQELESVSAILRDRGLKTVVIVTDGFHAARVRAIGTHFGLRVHTSPVPNTPYSGVTQHKKMISESLALGAARLFGYERVYKVKDSFQSPH